VLSRMPEDTGSHVNFTVHFWRSTHQVGSMHRTSAVLAGATLVVFVESKATCCNLNCKYARGATT
jgi:hypothetical protein